MAANIDAPEIAACTVGAALVIGLLYAGYASIRDDGDELTTGEKIALGLTIGLTVAGGGVYAYWKYKKSQVTVIQA